MYQFDDLSKLLSSNERAYEYYTSLPYNIQRELINNKDEIHNLRDLKNFVELVDTGKYM
jgi:hypothetical protein